MAKTIADIDNHRNAIKKSFFGGSIAAVGTVGSTLVQLKEVLPLLIIGGVVLLAVIMS